MNARSAALLLFALAACASPSGRAPESPAARGLPEPDPALRGTPRQQPLPLLSSEEVAVRVRRGPSGRPVVVEFLSAGLSEEDRLKLRAAYEQGRLRITREGSAGDDTWITTLQPIAPR